MDTIVFEFWGGDVTTGELILVGIVLLLFAYLLRYIFSKKLTTFLASKQITPTEKSKFRFRSLLFISLLLVWTIIKTIGITFVITEVNGQYVNLSLIIEALAIITFAALLDWFISYVFIRDFFIKRANRYKKESTVVHDANDKKATRLVQFIVYLYVIRMMLLRFDLDIVLFQRVIQKEIFTVTLSDVIIAILIILIARLLVWFVTQVTLFSVYKNKKMDVGAQYAINQLVTYVIYVVAIIMAMEQVISDMKVIYGGAAALLVGVGLGLQQTFNDFFSGLVLLFERTVMVGDIVEMDGRVGKVLRIGLRSSLIETRQNVSLLVPNSKLVNEFVVNWTHYDDIVRFDINVGVAYGSDTALVKDLLIRSLKVDERVLPMPLPFVRFNDFGDSALHFTVYFFSRNSMNIEDVKSEVRFEMDKLFRANNISIPFPQTDVWLRNSGK